MENKQLKFVTLLSSVLLMANFSNVLADDTASTGQEATVVAESTASQETPTTEVTSDNTELTDSSTEAPAVSSEEAPNTSKETSVNEESEEVSDVTTETPAPEITQEQYQENVADLTKVSINEVYQMFTSDENKHLLYVGRPTCYYCRQFSPELKKLNELKPVEYYNTDGDDFDENAKNFLFGTVGIPGTPTLIRLENGEVISAWVGGGDANDIYHYMFKNIESSSIEQTSSEDEDTIENNDQENQSLSNEQGKDEVVNKETNTPYTTLSVTPTTSNKEATGKVSDTVVAQATNTTLPKTGEKKDSLIILGTLVSLFAYGFFRKTDKKRDNY